MIPCMCQSKVLRGMEGRIWKVGCSQVTFLGDRVCSETNLCMCEDGEDAGGKKSSDQIRWS